MASTKWHCCLLLPLDVEELHHVNHHHVAEGTEAGEEEDAAVQFEVETKADELAHEFPKNRVLPTSTVAHQEGKASEVEQICECQVQPNYGAALSRPHLEAVNTNDNETSWEAHQEDHVIHNVEVQSLQTNFHTACLGKSPSVSCWVMELAKLSFVVFIFSP